MQLSLLEPNDLERLVCHFRRFARENGVDGELYNPYPPGHEVDPEAVRLRRRGSWQQALDTPGWSRTWGLWHRDQVVGHVELFGGRIAAEAHRARLGLGLEGPFRGRGHGRRLMDACLRWARTHPEVAWIDLGVFADNARARALYESLGFTLVGQITDRFRVADVSIDNLAMTLQV